MDPRRLRDLLQRFRERAVSLDQVMAGLRDLPFEDIGDAKIDHHRRLRRGAPEIVYGEGKTPDQIVRICERMTAAGGPVVATRLSEPALQALQERIAGVRAHPEAGVAVMGRSVRKRKTGIVVCSGGTTDGPVAEEAAVVLEALGHQVTRLVDIGVAGLHRLLSTRSELDRARVIIAVAGMEGALPSVVAGMTGCPVIGVPTSVGYGAAFGGIAALLSMLTSCAGGLMVVNIDNGVGAALGADLIVHCGTRK